MLLTFYASFTISTILTKKNFEHNTGNFTIKGCALRFCQVRW